MLIRRLWRVFKQIVYASFQRRLRSSRLFFFGVRGCASFVLRIRECLTRSVYSFFRGKSRPGCLLDKLWTTDSVLAVRSENGRFTLLGDTEK